MERPWPNEAKATHVYLIKRSDDAIKVGISKSPRKRLSILANASPDKLTLLRKTRVGKSAAYLLEARVKSLLRPCRIRGEWFNCSEQVAIVALHVAGHEEPALGELLQAKIHSEQARDWSSNKEWDEALYNLFLRFPDYMKHMSPIELAMVGLRFEDEHVPNSARPYLPQRPRPVVTIYPEDWNRTRLEANRAQRRERTELAAPAIP